MGMMLLPSPPSLAVDMSTAVLTTAYLQFGTRPRLRVLRRERVLSCSGSGEQLRGFFLLLPDPASLQAILTAVRVAVSRDGRRPRSPRERDRDVLRSFARRIDPSDAGRAQQPRRPLLQQGAVRGGGRRVHARARARPEDAGRAAQPRDRVLQHRLLRHARRRAARAAARAPRRSRSALGARPHATRCSATATEAVAEFTRAAAVRTRTTSARSCSSALAEKQRTAISSRRSAGSSARSRSTRRARCVHFYTRRGAVQPRAERRGAARARARDRAQPREPRRATT